MGLGPSSLKAHKPLIGNNSYVGPKISSPSVFEAGDCSKKSHPGLGPSQCDLAVCPLSPGKEKVVVPSAMLLTCSEDSSLPPEVHVKPTMDTESIISELSLLPEEQMSVKNTHTFPEPMHVADVSQSPTVLVPSAVASIASPVAKDDGGEKKVGMDMSLVECPESSNFEGFQNCCPTIRELVGDLDKSWDNSKDWMLQLRDGRQIVIPLSLYRPPGSESDCSVMEGEATTARGSSLFQHHAKNKKCFVCNKPTLGIFNTAHGIRKRIDAEALKEEISLSASLFPRMSGRWQMQLDGIGENSRHWQNLRHRFREHSLADPDELCDLDSYRYFELILHWKRFQVRIAKAVSLSDCNKDKCFHLPSPIMPPSMGSVTFIGEGNGSASWLRLVLSP
ncbi:zinc finger ccch domain-containing protein 1 [Quercus suber]|uniref:Zinc finger ccch domain-containing protein 1 n=1 Tax=Quercus suber TaxID=58331 RepID=A0AAW0JYV9_QUESU